MDKLFLGAVVVITLGITGLNWYLVNHIQKRQGIAEDSSSTTSVVTSATTEANR